MVGPVDIPLTDSGGGVLFGEDLGWEREGDLLHLWHGEEAWRVGLPAGATALRLGPSFGPLPFLLRPDPPLIVPTGLSVTHDFAIPLHAELGAVASKSLRLKEFGPPDATRSLYGPVDFGWLCWTVRDIDRTRARATFGTTLNLWASVRLTIRNHASGNHEVSKIMMPHESMGLYGHDEELRVSNVQMTLLSDHAAELIMTDPSGAKPISDVSGVALSPTRRTFALSHSYRNKTGLEYGF